MKLISLTQGQQAMVDDDDFVFLNKLKWHARRRPDKVSWEAGRGRYEKGIGSRIILMHREIMNASIDEVVDHADGNPLNNQKSNLRLCNRIRNGQNRKLHSNSTTGYKGVWFYDSPRCVSKYRANIRVNKKLIILGMFKTPEEAAMAYNNAAVEYFGEFARLNIIK